MCESRCDFGVNQLLVDLVGKHRNLLVSREHFAECADFIGWIGRATRIRRRIPHDTHGARRDCCGKRFWRHAESVRNRARNLDALRACKLNERLVRNPRRRRQQHFITAAWLDDRLQGHVNRVLRADRHRDLFKRSLDAVLDREFARDCLACGLVTGRWRVLRHALLERGNGDALDVLRCIKVGFAHGERDHVVTLRARGGGLCTNCERCALSHRGDTRRDEHRTNCVGGHHAGNVVEPCAHGVGFPRYTLRPYAL